MNKQHEALRMVLKSLSREDLETYTICTALTLFSIVDAVGATAISTKGILDEPLTNECYRVSLLVRNQVEKVLLKSN